MRVNARAAKIIPIPQIVAVEGNTVAVASRSVIVQLQLVERVAQAVPGVLHEAGWSASLYILQTSHIAAIRHRVPRLLLLPVDCQAVDKQLHGQLVPLHRDGFESQLLELICVGIQAPRGVAE